MVSMGFYKNTKSGSHIILDEIFKDMSTDPNMEEVEFRCTHDDGVGVYVILGYCVEQKTEYFSSMFSVYEYFSRMCDLLTDVLSVTKDKKWVIMIINDKSTWCNIKDRIYGILQEHK